LNARAERVIVSPMRHRRALFLALFVGTALACGSRTGLLVPEEAPPPEEDAGSDARHPRDVSFDQIPPIDSTPHPDVQRICQDAALTFIYVITVDNLLLSFDPTGGQFTPIGVIACPTTTPTATPFSMAVDRQGIARVVFNDGELFRVSLASAACAPTPWTAQPCTSPFSVFGMAYVSDDTGGGETLYIASDGANTSPSPFCMNTMPPPARLGSIDAKYGLHDIGQFSPPLIEAELTGTGDGRLFGFDAPGPNSDSRLVQIDKNTGDVIGQTPLPGVIMGGGWAFGFWGGDFYFFTAPGGPSTSSIVQRYRPTDGSIAQIAALPNEIVGAGVSTCAPEL
jgi:hypothetical protein